MDDDVIGLVAYGTGACSEPYYGYVATLTVHLLSEPKDTVLMTLTSTLPSEAAPLQNLLAITADDWGMPKTIDILSIDDPTKDGDRPFNITISTLFSQDADYGTASPNKAGEAGSFSARVGFVSMDDPDDTGATACGAGYWGYYADVGSNSPLYNDLSGCFRCPAGTWVDEALDKLWCRACPPGTYGLVEAAVSSQSTTSWDGADLDPGCLPCPNGTYSDAWGATACHLCDHDGRADVPIGASAFLASNHTACATIGSIAPQPAWMSDPAVEGYVATIGDVSSVYHHWRLLKKDPFRVPLIGNGISVFGLFELESNESTFESLAIIAAGVFSTLFFSLLLLVRGVSPRHWPKVHAWIGHHSRLMFLCLMCLMCLSV